MGGGTYSGIEYNSNGLEVCVTKVETKRTMLYMAVSLT